MHIHLLDNDKCRFQHWEDTSKDWVTGFDNAFQKSNLKRIYEKSTWLYEFTGLRSIIHTTGVSSFHWMAQLVFLKTYVSGGKHCTCCLKTTRAWLLNLCNLNNWCELIDFLVKLFHLHLRTWVVFTRFSPYNFLSVCIHVKQLNTVNLKKRTVDFKTAFHATNSGLMLNEVVT